MNKENQGIEINLLQLIKKLYDNVIYIAVATIIFGIIGYAGSKMFITPVYEAGAKMIVNTRNDVNQNVTNDQLNSAKNLVDTYAVIIRGRDVLKLVISELNLSENYGQLSEAVTVKSINGTQVMQISVYHNDPNTALAITEKIMEIAPDAITRTVEAGSVNPVEQPYVSFDPVEPMPVKNAVLMAMLGFFIACIVIVVIHLTDNTYKSDLDVQKDLDLPVLGVIPAIETCIDHSNYVKNTKRGGIV